MSIINSRNLRRFLSNQSIKQVGKEVVKDNILLASNRAINGINKSVSKGIDNTINTILDIPGSLVNEVANSNSTHEGTGTFAYNLNNNRNYNYDLANQYLNQYKSYVEAKSYINSMNNNLAYHIHNRHK